jgi:hypothetical protein
MTNKKLREKKGKRRKRKTRKIEEMRLFSFPYLHRGHQFDHVSRGEGIKIKLNKIAHFLFITLKSDHSIFSPFTM